MPRAASGGVVARGASNACLLGTCTVPDFQLNFCQTTTAVWARDPGSQLRTQGHTCHTSITAIITAHAHAAASIAGQRPDPAQCQGRRIQNRSAERSYSRAAYCKTAMLP